MEIEVGEYVRNDDGYIEKMNLNNIDTIYKDEEGKFRKYEGEDDWGNEYSSLVTKHSKNIIDLIEVGDYVNGYRILQKTKTKNNEIQVCILKDNNIDNWRVINNETLKSIVTKEQFANIEFRLEN